MCERETTGNSCKRCSERLVPIPETARILGIAEKTVRNKLSLGTFEIPARRYGRRILFKMSEVLAFIDSLE